MSKKNTLWYVNVAIMIALYFGISAIPPIGSITELGMKVLGVTFAMLYGWITVDLLWTSLLGFVMLQHAGYITSVAAGLATGLGNATVMMTIVTLVFAFCLSQLGVSDMLAGWLIQRKIMRGRPLMFVVVILFGTAMLSMAGGGLAVIFLMWDVVRAVCRANGVAENDTFKGVLMAWILILGMCGFILPWQNTVWLMGGFFTKAGIEGLVIPAMPVMYCGLIWLIVSTLLCIIVAKYVLRMDMSGMLITEDVVKQFEGREVTIYQKAGGIGLLIYIGLLLFGNIFKNVPISAVINAYGVVGLSVIFMAVFCIWKKPDGKSVLDIGKAFRELPWAVIMLLAITVPLGDALQSGDTGVMGYIARCLYPIVSGMSPTMFIIAVTIILGILTQFLHNVICGAVFLPMLTPILVQMGGNPYVFFFCIFVALMSAYATPASSMFAGIIFGTKDISTKAGYLSGWVYIAITLVVLCALMPVWTAIMPTL